MNLWIKGELSYYFSGIWLIISEVFFSIITRNRSKSQFFAAIQKSNAFSSNGKSANWVIGSSDVYINREKWKYRCFLSSFVPRCLKQPNQKSIDLIEAVFFKYSIHKKAFKISQMIKKFTQMNKKFSQMKKKSNKMKMIASA